MGEVDKILEQIEVEISKIDLYDYDIIETSLSMVLRLQDVLTETNYKPMYFPQKRKKYTFSKTRSLIY